MNVGWYETMTLYYDSILLVTYNGPGYLCVGGLKGGRDRVSVLWELAESGGKV